MPTYYTLQIGILAELLNDQAICDILMSINSVPGQGRCLIHHYSGQFTLK